jgi:DNA (cytosine-5)-methyltransferase 1
VLTVGSLFSSVGGLDLGLHRAGFRHAFFCEQDGWRRGILARHWPGVPIFDDVRAVRVESAARDQGDASGPVFVEAGRVHPIPVPVDLLAGGFPCQDLSVAGRRRGFAGERSSLFFEFARVAGELVPAGGMVLIENVPGLLSSDDGRDFAVLLATLAELGFHDLAWRVLDSRHFGVPQRRRRVFILARRARGDRCAQILLEPQGGGGHLAASGEAGPGTAATLTSGSHGAGVNAPGRRKEDDVNLVAGTVRSHVRPGSNDSGGIVAPAIVRRYGKGTDSDASDALIVNALDRQAGEPDDNSAQGNHLVSHTLTSEGFDASEDGTGRGTPLTTFDAEFSNHGVHGTPDESGALTRKLRKSVHGAGAVRRLTPTECERLQDWPDGWTVPTGPSLADTRLRLEHPEDPQPDGPRYAACGDGVTASVAEWIGRRILEHEEGRLAA